MEDFFKVTQLKYEIENPALKERALKFGIISVSREIMFFCENLIETGCTGFYPGFGYFHLNMLRQTDWSLLVRVWKWLYIKPNKRQTGIIAFFSGWLISNRV